MTAEKPISYTPTDGLTYDPSDAKYWQPDKLSKEVTRVFEICHGCRMCFKYCDSFPTLFKLIDEKHEGDVAKLSHGETQSVMDACFQCKLCEVQCPYTPRDKHEYQLDFPKLVHRWTAVHNAGKEPTLRERALSDPDGTARFARLSFGLANALNKVPLHRKALEMVLGIHHEKKLPDFAQQTFEKWAKKNDKVRPPSGGEKPNEAVLFQTCYVQNNDPELGRDTLEVLERNGVPTACAEGLVCCGMPAWERGDLEGLRERAHVNLAILAPYVDAGAKVLPIQPTCSMMMRREYPELLEGDDRARAKKVAEAVRDPGELLWSIRNEPRFSSDFKTTPGDKVSYHAPCHLRAQGIGFKGRDLLKRIPGVTIATTMECSGHDGTYSMKVETYEASKRVGEKAFQSMRAANAEVWVSECPLAGMQFEQHAGTPALHPMTVLARAYREDGFPQMVPEKKKE